MKNSLIKVLCCLSVISMCSNKVSFAEPNSVDESYTIQFYDDGTVNENFLKFTFLDKLEGSNYISFEEYKTGFEFCIKVSDEIANSFKDSGVYTFSELRSMTVDESDLMNQVMEFSECLEMWRLRYSDTSSSNNSNEDSNTSSSNIYDDSSVSSSNASSVSDVEVVTSDDSEAVPEEVPITIENEGVTLLDENSEDVAILDAIESSIAEENSSDEVSNNQMIFGGMVSVLILCAGCLGISFITKKKK